MISTRETSSNKKKLYYAFVDLEKALDRFTGEVVRGGLRKR